MMYVCVERDIDDYWKDSFWNISNFGLLDDRCVMIFNEIFFRLVEKFADWILKLEQEFLNDEMMVKTF